MCLLYCCLSFVIALWLGHLATKKAQKMAKKRQDGYKEINDTLGKIVWSCNNGLEYIIDSKGNRITRRNKCNIG